MTEKDFIQSLGKAQGQLFLLSFALFLCPPHFFLSLLLPLTSDKADSNNNWGQFPYTSRGLLLLWESVWEWKRSGGCVCVREDSMVGEVWTELSQIWQWKNNRHHETIRHSPMNIFTVLLGEPFEIGCDIFSVFLFVRPPAFCSSLLPLGGSHLSSLIVKTPAFQWPSCTLAEL